MYTVCKFPSLCSLFLFYCHTTALESLLLSLILLSTSSTAYLLENVIGYNAEITLQREYDSQRVCPYSVWTFRCRIIVLFPRNEAFLSLRGEMEAEDNRGG